MASAKLSLGNRGGEVEDGTVGEQRRKLLHYNLQKGVACRWLEALTTGSGGGPPGGDPRAGWSLEQPGT